MKLPGISSLALAVLACAPEPVQSAAPAASTVVAAPERTDPCRKDIPDCQAACALRESNRLENIDWFDMRCAAVVLGKNPDKVVGVADAAGASDAPVAPAVALDCDPPFSIRADGIKSWKRECIK